MSTGRLCWKYFDGMSMRSIRAICWLQTSDVANIISKSDVVMSRCMFNDFDNQSDETALYFNASG